MFDSELSRRPDLTRTTQSLALLGSPGRCHLTSQRCPSRDTRAQACGDSETSSGSQREMFPRPKSGALRPTGPNVRHWLPISVPVPGPTLRSAATQGFGRPRLLPRSHAVSILFDKPTRHTVLVGNWPWLCKQCFDGCARVEWHSWAWCVVCDVEAGESRVLGFERIGNMDTDLPNALGGIDKACVLDFRLAAIPITVGTVSYVA